MARRKRPGPLDIVLLEDSSFGVAGSSSTGRRKRVSRKTGRATSTGWGAEFKVRDPYSVTIDARDLATITGNKLLPYFKNTLRANLDYAGRSQDEPMRNRILQGRRGIMDADADKSQWSQAVNYLVDALRRTWQSKNYPKGGRWTNRKKTHLKIYFHPNGRSGASSGLYRPGRKDADGKRKATKITNPAAAWNKLQDVLGMPNIGIGGAPDALIKDALDEWTAKVMDGRSFKRDTKADALGK